MKRIFPLLLAAVLLAFSTAPAQAARDKDLQPMADSLTNYLTEKTTVRSFVNVEKATVLNDGTLDPDALKTSGHALRSR